MDALESDCCYYYVLQVRSAFIALGLIIAMSHKWKSRLVLLNPRGEMREGYWFVVKVTRSPCARTWLRIEAGGGGHNLPCDWEAEIFQ